MSQRFRPPYAALLPILVPSLLAAGAHAQGPAFDSPGLPSLSTMGQTTRFSNEFNPAFGAVIDLVGDFRDRARANAGTDIDLRLVEVNASAYVDPSAWAYLVITSESLENVGIEEAAVEYTGLPGNHTLKAGRFFVDFGKQMQLHPEELRTLERPLPLREFLGEELAGTGVQYDNWFALNDATPLRFSVGVFSSLAGDGHHAEEDDAPAPDPVTGERKDVDELSFSARVTGMTDVGDSGVFQLGGSARYVPEFAYEFHDAGLEVPGRTNLVAGIDATYSWTSDTGQESWLFGGEYLIADGDLSAALDRPSNPTAINVVDDTVDGLYAFGDYAWNRYHSAGVQFAMADLPEDPATDARELDAYYTWNMTEFRRLRFGVTVGEEAGRDETAVYVQFTNFFGNHAHGLNW